MCAKRSDNEEISECFSYSYLGGGVPGDPPFGYGLVSKRLPIPVADRLLAVCLFLSGGHPRVECFVRRIDVTGEDGVSVQEADKEIDERVKTVTRHLKQLHGRYKSSQDLLSSCELSVADNWLQSGDGEEAEVDDDPLEDGEAQAKGTKRRNKGRKKKESKKKKKKAECSEGSRSNTKKRRRKEKKKRKKDNKKKKE